jgi:hypothetical protein
MPETALDPSAERHAADARPKRIRSAVSNGRRLFVDGDGNSAWSRRYRDLIVGHISDMGGRDTLSEAQLSLIKRASTLELQLEQAEGRLSKGEQIDLDCYGRAASHLRRILESLGLERKPRTITPTLEEYARRVERNGAGASV